MSRTTSRSDQLATTTAHAAQLQTRLLVALDTLDSQSLAHASELASLQASHDRLEARARRLEYERNTANEDLAEMTSVLEVVIEKGTAANDYKVLAHSDLHLPSPLSPPRRAHSSRTSAQADTTTDPSAYTAALVSALTAQLDAARAQGARDRAEAERKIAKLEAMVELRDVELTRNLSRSLNGTQEPPHPTTSAGAVASGSGSGSGSAGEGRAWRSSGMSRGEAIAAYELVARDNERLEKEVTRLRAELAASDFTRATSEIGPSSSWAQLPDWARPQPPSEPQPQLRESKSSSSKRRQEAESNRAQSASSDHPPSSISASYSDRRPSGSSTPDSYRALPSALQSTRADPSVLESTRAGPSTLDSSRAAPTVDSSRAAPSAFGAPSTSVSRPRTGSSTLDPHRTRSSISTVPTDSHRPRSSASGSTADPNRPRSSASDANRPRSSTLEINRPRSSASDANRPRSSASRRSQIFPLSESESERDGAGAARMRQRHVPTRRSGLRDSGIGADSGTDRASGTGRVRERERATRADNAEGGTRHGRSRQAQAQQQEQEQERLREQQHEREQEQEQEESTATRAQNLMPLLPALTPSKVRAPRVEVVELPSTSYIEPSFGVDLRGGRGERRGSGPERRRGDERRGSGTERIRGEERRGTHAERRGSGDDRRAREAGSERGDTERASGSEPMRIGELEPMRTGGLEPLRMNMLEPPRTAVLGPMSSPRAISPVGELHLPPSVVSRAEGSTQPALVPTDLIPLGPPSTIQSPSLVSVEPAQTAVSPPSTLQPALVPVLQPPLIPTPQPAPILQPSPMLHTALQNTQPQRSRSSSRTPRLSPPVFDLTGLPAYEAVPGSSAPPAKDLDLGLVPPEGSPVRRQSDPAPSTQPNSPPPVRPRANSAAPSTPPRSTNNTAQFAFITPVHVDTYGKEGEGAGDAGGTGNVASTAVEPAGVVTMGDASAFSATGAMLNPGNTSNTNTTGRRRLLPLFKFMSPSPGTPPSTKKRRSMTAPSQFRTSTSASGGGGAGSTSPMGIAASPLARGRPVRESPLQLVLGSAHAARRAEMRVPVMREVGGAGAGIAGVVSTGLVPLVPFAPLVPLVAPLVPSSTQSNPSRSLMAPPASSIETVLRGMEAERALLSRAQVGGEVTAEGMAHVLLIEAECLRLRRDTADAEALRQEVAHLRTRLQEQASVGADSMMEQDYTTTTSMTSRASESAETYSDAEADSILTATDEVDPARRRLRDVEQGLRDARAELDAKERAVAELRMRLGGA